MASSQIGIPKPRRKPPITDFPLDQGQREAFRTALLHWFRLHARVLPWRGSGNAYHVWVSEIMLQQTRVDAAIDHYRRFVTRFPTMLALSLADEDDVLAIWSGLGYYRRARMLHQAAKFVVRELAGVLPRTAAELVTLPGVGPYTAAAIASICFGQMVAVLDGNVERVLLRVSGRAEETTQAATDFLQAFAQALLHDPELPPVVPGEFNQAMMELGATVCLPRKPLCISCPVVGLCRTRGEHPVILRPPAQPELIHHALYVRPFGVLRAAATPAAQRHRRVEILLQRRASDASRMPGMLELPQLETAPDAAPCLTLQHSIVRTRYTVQVFDQLEPPETGSPGELFWVPATELGNHPLTGLARKILERTRYLEPQ